MNNIYWEGSLAGKAALVGDACELAVSKADGGDLTGYRDSRGLNRAPRGDFEGAIEAFELVVVRSNRASVADRVERLAALKAGESPFTEGVLAPLKNE